MLPKIDKVAVDSKIKRQSRSICENAKRARLPLTKQTFNSVEKRVNIANWEQIHQRRRRSTAVPHALGFPRFVLALRSRSATGERIADFTEKLLTLIGGYLPAKNPGGLELAVCAQSERINQVGQSREQSCRFVRHSCAHTYKADQLIFCAIAE